MEHHAATPSDFGTGKKKLSLYLVGFVSCCLLTLLSFCVVLYPNNFSKLVILSIIFSSACVQFIVQVVCFLRLTTATQQGKTNIMTLLFTGVVLTSIIVGSLWIMWNLNYNMAH